MINDSASLEELLELDELFREHFGWMEKKARQGMQQEIDEALAELRSNPARAAEAAERSIEFDEDNDADTEARQAGYAEANESD